VNDTTALLNRIAKALEALEEPMLQIANQLGGGDLAEPSVKDLLGQILAGLGPGA